MDHDFIKSLTPEQKAELKKLLDVETPKYRVEVKMWENGHIRSLTEYLGDQLHGKYLGWHSNGQKYWEEEFRNGRCIS